MLDLFKTYQLTSKELVALGLFPSVDAAGHSLKILANKEKIVPVGYHRERTGKSFVIYFSRAIAPKLVKHEYELSLFCLMYKKQWLRGYKVNRQLQPDAETMETPKRFIEWDRNTMGIKQIKKRFSDYENSLDLFKKHDHLVIWICRDESRRKELMELARTMPIGDAFMFGIAEEVMSNPLGDVFLTTDGVKCVLDIPLDDRFDRSLYIDDSNPSC